MIKNMSTQKGILLLSVVMPGFLAFVISLYYFGTDYSELIKAESYLTKLVNSEKTNQRTLDYAYHRASLHRINTFADGVWGLLGLLIMSVGIHGMVTLNDQE
jgi:hypothetical protein